jgi:hypothetical protein
MRKIAYTVLALIAFGCTEADVMPIPAELPVAEAAPLPPVFVIGDGSSAASFALVDVSFSIVTQWPGAEPGEEQTLEFVGPHGEIFRKVSDPLDSSGMATVEFHVRGTAIEDYSMTGIWTIRAYRNGAELPAGSTTFTIQP